MTGPHRWVTFDAANPASCHALVAAAVADGPLDIVCNIAGMLDWGLSADFDESRFQRLLQVNLVGVFAVCRAALNRWPTHPGTLQLTADVLVDLDQPAGAVECLRTLAGSGDDARG